MKKILMMVFLVLTTSALLCGCGGQSQPAQPGAKAEPAAPPAPTAPPLAVGEMVYVAYMQVPNSSMELAKVTAVSGQEVTIAWDDTWTKKGHEVETR